MKLAKLRYSQQKAQSKSRIDKNGNSIEWHLTFDEWMQIWVDSGHWEQRGRGIGKYCMSRLNDIGHYVINNVTIKLHTDNTSEGNLGRIGANLGKIGYMNGKQHSLATKIKISKSSIGRTAWNKGKKGVQTAWNKGLTGQVSPMLNKKHSEETKEKIRQSIINRSIDKGNLKCV